MKQTTNNKTTAQSQNREGVKDIISDTFRTIIQISYPFLSPPLEGAGGGTYTTPQEGQGGGSFTPPWEGQGGGQNKGKGPPGRVRSPGAGWCLRPDNQQPTNNKTNYNTEFQYFNQFFIFYHN
jgi:hypothetical protein